MKTSLSILLIFFNCLFSLLGQQSQDMYVEGLIECSKDNQELKLIFALFTEVDEKIKAYQDSENIYFDFAGKFSEDKIEASFFELEEDSKLDSLIQVGIKTKLWYKESGVAAEDEIVIVPPGGIPPESVQKKLQELMHLDPSLDFIRCSKSSCSEQSISTFYSLYDRLGIASSTVKLSAFYKMIDPKDFDLNGVKFFIAIEVVLQKMLAANAYDKKIFD